jgi:hypothetical protein
MISILIVPALLMAAYVTAVSFWALSGLPKKSKQGELPFQESRRRQS